MNIILTIKATAGKKEFTLDSTQVEVKEKLGAPITYTITFPEDVCETDFQLLREVSFNPFAEIAIFVKINKGDNICLVKGPVLKHDITLMHGGEGSTLKISGADNSIKLGWKTESKNWEKNITRDEIVSILKNGSYQFQKFNVLGKPINFTPPKDAKNTKKDAAKEEVVKTLKQNQVQREPDLTFIQKLGKQCGYYFWVTYDTDKDSTDIANFGELPLNSSHTHELIINHEKNNIDQLTINWDADRPTIVQSGEVNIKSKKVEKNKDDKVPELNENNITLKDLTQGAYSTLLTFPGSDINEILDKNKAALNESSWFIHASCATSLDQLCTEKIIRAHTVVKLTGAGTRYDGRFVVSGVTHTIDSSSYKMQLELIRNGWNKNSDESKKMNEKKPEKATVPA